MINIFKYFIFTVCFLIVSQAKSYDDCGKLVPNLPIDPVCKAFELPKTNLEGKCKASREDTMVLNELKKMTFTFKDKNQQEYQLNFEGNIEPTKITFIIRPKEHLIEQVGYVTLTSNSLFMDTLEIETYLDPKYQGKGIGPGVRQAMHSELKKMNLPAKFIVSIVAEDNIPSISMNNRLSPNHSCEFIRWPSGRFASNHYLFLYDLKK